MPDAPAIKFTHVKPGDTEFKNLGLRDFFAYRDLGIAAATGGNVIAQLTRAQNAPEKGAGWHYHVADFHIVIMLKGWPQGKLKWRGRKVIPAAIQRMALLTVEGENDDIGSLGQTLAAHDLCSGLRRYMLTHYIEAGAGHYGVFSGRRWNNNIYPVVREAIQVAA